MTISATMPGINLEEANAELEAKGFGPNNFTIPVSDGSDSATHAGLHSWDDLDFYGALQELQHLGVSIQQDAGSQVNFMQHLHSQALQWVDPESWFINPVMAGDERTLDGELWRSSIDYNVWKPPVFWAKVTAVVEPWVRPLNAGMVYPLDALVSHDNPNDGGTIWVYRSNLSSNDTEPGRDATFDRWWAPISPLSSY